MCPLTGQGRYFATIADLADAISATKDTTVVAADPTDPTSMWLTDGIEVEQLTEAEIAEIRALLGAPRE